MNNSGIHSIVMASIILAAAIGASAQPAKILAATGKLTMLRTHDQGTKYGPANDSIDAEIAIALNTAPGKSFGFQLRADDRNPSRRAMYDLLLHAYVHDWTVRIDYFQLSPERRNHILFRAWVTKDPRSSKGLYP